MYVLKGAIYIHLLLYTIGPNRQYMLIVLIQWWLWNIHVPLDDKNNTQAVPFTHGLIWLRRESRAGKAGRYDISSQVSNVSMYLHSLVF